MAWDGTFQGYSTLGHDLCFGQFVEWKVGLAISKHPAAKSGVGNGGVGKGGRSLPTRGSCHFFRVSRSGQRQRQAQSAGHPGSAPCGGRPADRSTLMSAAFRRPSSLDQIRRPLSRPTSRRRCSVGSRTAQRPPKTRHAPRVRWSGWVGPSSAAAVACRRRSRSRAARLRLTEGPTNQFISRPRPGM